MKSRPFTLQVAAFLIIRTAINTCIRMVGPFLLVFARGVGADMTSMATAVSASMAASAVGPFLAEIADRRGRKSRYAAWLDHLHTRSRTYVDLAGIFRVSYCPVAGQPGEQYFSTGGSGLCG